MAFLRGSRYYCDIKHSAAPGGRVYQSLGTSDPKEAALAEAKIKADLDAKLVQDPFGRIESKFLTLVDCQKITWEKRWAAGKDGQKQFSQISHIIGLVGNLPLTQFLDKENSEEKTGVELCEHIRDILSVGRAASTVDRYMTALKTLLMTVAFRYPAPWLQAHIPHIHIANPRNNRERILDAEEERTLLGLAMQRDPVFAQFLAFMVDTGFRTSEALKLTWGRHIRMAEEVIFVDDTKSGPGRSILMTSRVKRLLADRARETTGHQKVWPANWNPSNLGKKFNHYKITMGLMEDKGFCLYMLRHTCLTRLMAAENDHALVQLWSGHSNPVMLKRYTHLAAKHLGKLRGSLDAINKGVGVGAGSHQKVKGM